MISATTRAKPRRLKEGFYKYCAGRGLDIGCGATPITSLCERWDIEDGDAQLLEGIHYSMFDWIYSSHCLEHLASPAAALRRWWEVLKPGGYLLLAVPDEDAYEQYYWPSPFNGDHKHSFCVQKDASWCPDSYSLTDLLRQLPLHRIVRISVTDDIAPAPISLTPQDRTLDGGLECSIEAIVQKLSELPHWRSTYKRRVECPRCGHPGLVLQGRDLADRICLRCPYCVTKCYSSGALGEIV